MKKLMIFFFVFSVIFYSKPAWASEKIRIGVVDFATTNMSSESGKVVAATLRREMAKYDFLDIPSWEEVEAVFGKQDSLYKLIMEQTDCINLTCATKVCRALNAPKTVIGTVVPQEGLIFLNATMIDVTEWDTEFVAAEFCENEAGIPHAAARLAQKVVRWLVKPGESPEAAKKRRIEDEKKDEIKFTEYRQAKLAKLRVREKGTCPPEMVLIPAGEYISGSSANDTLRYKVEPKEKNVTLDEYCIDKYEHPNNPARKPRKKNEWYGAKDICEKQGKRLCKDEEWEKACKGPENLRYPYGNEYDPDKCNTESGEISTSGSYKECVSGYGAFDMSGNMKEWIASESRGIYLNMRGGAYNSKDRDTRCAAFRRVIPFGSRTEYGFRCCK